jgi:hypothetical protein
MFQRTFSRELKDRSPAPSGALDAIHLVSAVVFRDRLADGESPLLFGTHDRALAGVAATTNFEVLGA